MTLSRAAAEAFGYLFLGIWVRSILGLYDEWNVGMVFDIEGFAALGSGRFHFMVSFFGLVEGPLGAGFVE